MSPIRSVQAKSAEEELRYRIAFEKLITNISTNFINLAVNEIDSGIMRALQNVCEFTGDDRSYVILYSEDGRIMDTIYEWCAESIPAQADRIRGRAVDGMPWFTAQIRQLLVVNLLDINSLLKESPLDYEGCLLQGIQSILLIPLILHGGAIGFLGFDSVRSQKLWQEDTVTLLKIFGEIIVNALSRKQAEVALREAYAELEQRIDERTREIERRSRASTALRDVLRVLNSNRDLPEVLEYIVKQACQLLNATATIIRKADLENQVVTTEAAYNLPVEFDVIRRTKLYYNTNDLILMSRRPVVIPDIQSTYRPALTMPDVLDDFQQAYMQALVKYYKGMLSVPLFIKNEIFGSLTFYFQEYSEFSEEDIQLALSMGDQAALAIENARLYGEERNRRQEAERRRQVAESLRDMMAVLNSNRSLDAILQQIVNQAVHLLNSDAVAIYRLRDKENILSIRASYGLSEDTVSQIRIPVGKGIAGHSILSRKPVAVSDLLTVPSMVGAADLLMEERVALEKLVDEYRAFLSVPLLGKDEVFGAITLYYRESRLFLQDEIELAVVFADQAALAIENARLRSQAERNAIVTERNRLARDLHDAVTQTLFSASLIAEVLPRLWDKNPAEGRRRLEELRELSRGALAEMRTLLLELRPSSLTETRLSDLLKQLAEAVTGRARLPVHLRVEGEIQLAPDVQVSLYRISQEALNNVVKHSGAEQAWIDLSITPGEEEGKIQLELSIQDDGHGFNPATIPPNHLGLSIMVERAQMIHADLKVESRQGTGTTIRVLWAG
jgi:nitrate/nitrite-specific signal transduction histidine kinase